MACSCVRLALSARVASQLKALPVIVVVSSLRAPSRVRSASRSLPVRRVVSQSASSCTAISTEVGMRSVEFAAALLSVRRRALDDEQAGAMTARASPAP